MKSSMAKVIHTKLNKKKSTEEITNPKLFDCNCDDAYIITLKQIIGP